MDFSNFVKIAENGIDVKIIKNYFEQKWSAKVHSVKFVFDFKGALNDITKIAEKSYMISKLKQKLEQ